MHAQFREVDSNPGVTRFVDAVAEILRQTSQRLLRAILFAMAIHGSPTAARADDQPSNSSRESVFALLDSLDFERTEDLAFVRVATGHWVRHDDAPPRNSYRFGFLKERCRETFRVRYLDLTEETLKATPQGTPAYERVEYTPWDLSRHALDVAKQLALSDQRDFGQYMSPRTPLSPKGEALFLARACARRGLEEEVDELLAAVGPLEGSIRDLADGLRTHLATDFANPALTRVALLQRHRKWLSAFPNVRSRDSVLSRARVLEKMVAEDRARAERVEPEMPTKEQVIADLIFSLADEYYPVEEWFVDGEFVHTPARKHTDGSGPTDHLKKMGLDAVPLLIEAMTDERLSRTVWYSSRYGGSMWVLTVGTFADELLKDISGLRFYGDVSERQTEWRSWWKAISEKGEEESLAVLAARGDSASEQAARLLVRRWPSRVSDVIEGVRRCTNPYWRADLVETLSVVKTEMVTEFFLDVLKNDQHSLVRVAAACALFERGRRDGVKVFVEQWPQTVAPSEHLAEFLLGSGDLQAISTIGRGLLSRSSAVRLAIFWSLDSETLAKSRMKAERSDAIQVEREFERILGIYLDDNYRLSGSSMGFTYGESYISLRDPLFSDLAACRLHQLWPQRYPRYVPTGPQKLRLRRLVATRNVWREQFGLDQLDVPQATDVRSTDPDTKEIIGRLLKAEGQGREPLLTELETLGLGVLPWVEDQLQAIPETHPARRDLLKLADRLCNYVRKASIKTEDWRPPESLRRLITGLNGKPLESKRLVELLTTAVGSLLDGTGELLLIADRLGDGAGITVTLTVTPLGDSGGRSVHSHESVLADDRTLFGRSGSGVLTAYDSVDDYEELREAVEESLAMAHDKTFEIWVQLSIRTHESIKKGHEP